MTVLVLDQSVPFDELAAAAERLGWHRDPDPLAPEPILPGEPELATWSHTDGGGRLVASFEPAVMLRSVAVTGEAAAAWADELAGALATLSRSDVEPLLRSGAPDEALRGVIAARELGDPELADALRVATESADETVAAEERAPGSPSSSRAPTSSRRRSAARTAAVTRGETGSSAGPRRPAHRGDSPSLSATAWSSDLGADGDPVLVGAGVRCASRREAPASSHRPFRPALRLPAH